MFRPLPYTLLFVVLLLMQLFLLDKLMISTMIAPMVYIAFVVLLPMNMSQLSMLMWGVAVGGVFDVMTGMMGLNSFATIFVCYVRWWVMNLTLGQEVVQLGSMPLPHLIGRGKFFRYMALMVTLHTAILLSVEFLRIDQMLFLLQRILLSSAISILFVWLIARQFELLLTRKL